MALVIRYDDVKFNQRKIESHHRGPPVLVAQTLLLGTRENLDMPYAQVSAYGPGRYSTPHYHDADQFQIMIEGKGKMGRHDVGVNSIHFSRAYTPYGPFIADPQRGLTCLIIRSHPDTGAQHSQEALAQVRRMPNRNPWQITRSFDFPELGSSNVSFSAVNGIFDDNGLATYTLNMAPLANALTPSLSSGNGLFVVVLDGGLIHEGQDANALTLVYVPKSEGRFLICAGAHGLKGLIVQFPRQIVLVSNVSDTVNRKLASAPWQCDLCSFTYDETVGLREDGIPPGTQWKDVPSSWSCPDCGASKSEFRRIAS